MTKKRKQKSPNFINGTTTLRNTKRIGVIHTRVEECGKKYSRKEKHPKHIFQ
jgi:hypothetical protein